MSYDRPQSSEIEAILAVADKIAKRSHHLRFVLDDKKRDEFLKLSSALAVKARSARYEEVDIPLPALRA